MGSESVSAMTRKRLSRPKLAPFTMSVAKCEAADALPPLPQVKMRRPSSRACARISIARPTFSTSIAAMAVSSCALYCSAKVIKISLTLLSYSTAVS